MSDVGFQIRGRAHQVMNVYHNNLALKALLFVSQHYVNLDKVIGDIATAITTEKQFFVGKSVAVGRLLKVETIVDIFQCGAYRTTRLCSCELSLAISTRRESECVSCVSLVHTPYFLPWRDGTTGNIPF